MDRSARQIRFVLLTAVILMGLAVLTVVTLVVPRALADPSPVAIPENAARGFVGWAVLESLVAIVVLLLARRPSENRSGEPGVLKGLGAVAVVVPLYLYMLAGAFQAHGPEMASVVTMLFICGTAGILAGGLIFYGGDCQQDLRQEGTAIAADRKRNRDSTGLTVLLAFLLMVASAFLILGFGDEGLGLVLGAALVVLGCFFIIRRNTTSLWYVPLIANFFLIAIAISNERTPHYSDWLPIAAYWTLCIGASFLAARMGGRTAKYWIPMATVALGCIAIVGITYALIPEKELVTFRIDAPGARQVFVTGSFNDWIRHEYPLSRQPEGQWQTTILVPRGRHEYKFIVDSVWIHDVNNPNKVQLKPASRGYNSVIVVGEQSGLPTDR